MESTRLLLCEKCGQMPWVSIWFREGNLGGKEQVRQWDPGWNLGWGFWTTRSRAVRISLWFDQLARPGSWQAPPLGGMNGMWILHFTLGCENTRSSLPQSVQGSQDSWGEGPGFPHKSKWRLQYYNPLIILSWHYFNIYLKNETKHATHWGIGEEVKEYSI